MFAGFINIDPPPERHRASITPKLLRYMFQLAGAGKFSTVDLVTYITAELAIMGFFWAMRSRMSPDQYPVELTSSDSVILCSERHSTPSSHIHRISWFCPARSVSQSHSKIRKMAKSSTLGRTNEQMTLSFVRHCDSLHSFTEPTATYPIAWAIPTPMWYLSTTCSPFAEYDVFNQQQHATVSRDELERKRSITTASQKGACIKCGKKAAEGTVTMMKCYSCKVARYCKYNDLL
jgi:hypothetical protein